MIVLNELGTPQLNTVHHCRAEALLSALDTASVDLVVTSPPYDNLRTYNGFSWNFEYIAQQSYRVLKPGGVLVWVVGDATIDGSESMTSFKQALYFREQCKFKLWDTMIWEKDTPLLIRGSNRYAPVFEYMFVVSKGTAKTFNPAMRKNAHVGTMAQGNRRQRNGENVAYKDKSAVNEESIMSNVWRIPTGYMKTTADIEAYEHPAMFPEALAERHILTWSNAGDVVLDFFGGSGTTAKMARKNGRNWLTNDISREYCDLMEKRLAQPYTLPMFAQVPA